MRASAGIPLVEGLVNVQKLGVADYREIARNFVEAMRDGDAARYLQAIESSESSVEFTSLMREEGQLAKWEEFRVENAVLLFVARLVAAGAPADASDRWGKALRESQQEARSQRLHRSSGDANEAKRRPLDPATAVDHLLDARVVAARALEYLSEAELTELRLPLGSVLRAIRVILGNR